MLGTPCLSPTDAAPWPARRRRRRFGPLNTPPPRLWQPQRVPPTLRLTQAYYRRGDAAFALAHFKDAVRDFRIAAKLVPSDPDLRRKVGRPEPGGLRGSWVWVCTRGGWIEAGPARVPAARHLNVDGGGGGG